MVCSPNLELGFFLGKLEALIWQVTATILSIELKGSVGSEGPKLGCQLLAWTELEALEWTNPMAFTNCPLENLNRKTFGFGLTGFTISRIVQIDFTLKWICLFYPKEKSLCTLNVGDIISELYVIFM